MLATYECARFLALGLNADGDAAVVLGNFLKSLDDPLPGVAVMALEEVLETVVAQPEIDVRGAKLAGGVDRAANAIHGLAADFGVAIGKRALFEFGLRINVRVDRAKRESRSVQGAFQRRSILELARPGHRHARDAFDLGKHLQLPWQFISFRVTAGNEAVGQTGKGTKIGTKLNVIHRIATPNVGHLKKVRPPSTRIACPQMKSPHELARKATSPAMS